MMRGTIVHHREDKHFGFIQPDDRTTPDIFFHVNNVLGDLPKIGDRVAFDFMADPMRPGRLRAMNVKLV
jgi:cold shock CspA family protein